MTGSGKGRRHGDDAGELAPLAVRPEEAFRLIAVSRAHGYRLLQSGQLRSFKSGRARLVPVAALEEWVGRQVG